MFRPAEESSLAPDGSTLANKCRYLARFPLSGNFGVELCAYCLITMSHYLPTLTKSTFPRVNLPRRKLFYKPRSAETV